MLFLLVLFAQELMGKRNKERHNREANKKQPPQKCVADYCLPLEYNALELPSSERQDVQINLEVLDVLRVDDKKILVESQLVFWRCVERT